MKQPNLLANPKRKFSAKQIAAQKRFAAMAKSGKFRKRKKNPVKAGAKRNPKKPESYWTYKAPPTPTFDELPDGAFKGTEADWHSLSPGMRREIVRQYERYVKPKKNPVKAGAKRNPPKRNPVEKYVIRGTKKTKTGYLHYYLGGNRFLSDFMNADRFGLHDGEKKMRAILHQLPREIDNITLIKAK